MATMKDVAIYAGVSVSTVSRALNNSAPVDRETKEKIEQAIYKLGYRPNMMAKALKEGKTKTIAFMIPNIENPIFPVLSMEAEEQARKRGYYVLMCHTRENLDREEEYVYKLLPQVDGFLFSTGLIGDLSKSIQKLRMDQVPVVCLMRESDDTNDTFISDAVQGGYIATKYLIQKGHKRIVTLSGRKELALYKYRLEGYKKALEEAGLPYSDNMVWNCVENGVERAQKVVTKKIQEGFMPQAIFAESDPLAFDAIIALNRKGYQVPRDISIVGFDNVPMAENYGLTTVEHPLEEMARDAVNHLIDLIETNNRKRMPLSIYPVKLVERNSVIEKDK